MHELVRGTPKVLSQVDLMFQEVPEPYTLLHRDSALGAWQLELLLVVSDERCPASFESFRKEGILI